MGVSFEYFEESFYEESFFKSWWDHTSLFSHIYDEYLASLYAQKSTGVCFIYTESSISSRCKIWNKILSNLKMDWDVMGNSGPQKLTCSGDVGQT